MIGAAGREQPADHPFDQAGVQHQQLVAGFDVAACQPALPEVLNRG
jgi:hypothetical protein